VLLLNGIDQAGNSYQEKWEITGSAKLPATSQKSCLILEVSGDLDQGVFLGTWSKDEFYFYAGLGNETIVFPNGNVGTYWEYNEDGSRISAEIISTDETVTVPSGIYCGCVLVEKHRISGTSPSPPWYEWWKPGFFIVKWTDYYAPNGPVEWELTSVEKVKK
jgi:hypothetical protein